MGFFFGFGDFVSFVDLVLAGFDEEFGVCVGFSDDFGEPFHYVGDCVPAIEELFAGEWDGDGSWNR